MQKDEGLSMWERLKLAVTELGYSGVDEYVRKNQLKRSTIYAIKSRGSPGNKTLSEIQKTGVNVRYLISGEGPKTVRPGREESFLMISEQVVPGYLNQKTIELKLSQLPISAQLKIIVGTVVSWPEVEDVKRLVHFLNEYIKLQEGRNG